MSSETVYSLQQELELVKQELERQSCELEQTTHEKNLSAEYGLVLLEEKKALQQRCEELESYYDSSRTELDLLREVSCLNFTSCINFNFILYQPAWPSVWIKF